MGGRWNESYDGPSLKNVYEVAQKDEDIVSKEPEKAKRRGTMDKYKIASELVKIAKSVIAIKGPGGRWLDVSYEDSRDENDTWRDNSNEARRVMMNAVIEIAKSEGWEYENHSLNRLSKNGLLFVKSNGFSTSSLYSLYVETFYDIAWTSAGNEFDIDKYGNFPNLSAPKLFRLLSKSPTDQWVRMDDKQKMKFLDDVRKGFKEANRNIERLSREVLKATGRTLREVKKLVLRRDW